MRRHTVTVELEGIYLELAEEAAKTFDRKVEELLADLLKECVMLQVERSLQPANEEEERLLH